MNLLVLLHDFYWIGACAISGVAGYFVGYLPMGGSVTYEPLQLSSYWKPRHRDVDAAKPGPEKLHKKFPITESGKDSESIPVKVTHLVDDQLRPRSALINRQVIEGDVVWCDDLVRRYKTVLRGEDVPSTAPISYATRLLEPRRDVEQARRRRERLLHSDAGDES